jgi:tetratricopeptide (TPR) repeat protein
VSYDPSNTVARAEALLREAHVLRMRRQFGEAETKCRQALELRPDDVAGLEMLGDLLAEKGAVKEAAAAYQQALDQAPGRAALETKYARAALAMGEQQHQREMAELLLRDPTASTAGRRRNPMMALGLSAFWPGLGQFYNQEMLKGGVLAGSSLLALLLGGDSFFRFLLALMGARVAPPTTGAVFGILYFFLWLYSVVDAPVRAQKLSADKGSGAGLL